MKRHYKPLAALAAVAALGGGGVAIAQATSAPTKAVVRRDGLAPGMGGAQLTSAEQTALEAALKAVAAQAPTIAKTVLDADVTAGTITSAQETTLLTLVTDMSSHEGGAGGGGGPMGGGHGGPGGGAPPTGASGPSGASGSTGSTGSTS